MVPRVAIALCCFALAAPPVHAQITDGFAKRTVVVTANSGTDLLFTDSAQLDGTPPGTDVPGLGPFNETVENFGFASTNTVAAFADQTSTIPQTLNAAEPSPILFQGSASLFASYNTVAPINAEATSVIDWTFAIDAATDLQLTWALAATAETIDGVSDRGPVGAAFSLARLDDPFNPVLSETAGLNQLTEGAGVFTIAPGDYRLFLQADLNFFADGSAFELPTDVSRTAAYTVTLAVVPTPASIALFALGLYACAARRHRTA